MFPSESSNTLTSLDDPCTKTNRDHAAKPIDGKKDDRAGLCKFQSWIKKNAAPKAKKPYSFCNWARNQRSNPAQIFYPKTVDDLTAIVHRAKAENMKSGVQQQVTRGLRPL
ncbi:hypothetical protein BGZ70_004803 [Mortierella alpina]|uniref:Uncharacterized protein n=1 Tax=Mortierella alpina TaxID=64518 RepID=A0A9P6J9T5_MORAP|nr:hypothetical protein BGZ70_004803 [Mortierella alpina]